tara:strand:- start:83 stop:277 length:195 start_codon:yes stop_codon:yes gene_type:complete
MGMAPRLILNFLHYIGLSWRIYPAQLARYISSDLPMLALVIHCSTPVIHRPEPSDPWNKKKAEK